ncbi:hypothetical protein AVEN_55874-1, partial [Araneus ventricosus]
LQEEQNTSGESPKYTGWNPHPMEVTLQQNTGGE